MRRGFGQRASTVTVLVWTSYHHQRYRPGSRFPFVIHQQAYWGQAWHLVARVGEGHQRASFRALVDIRLWGLTREFVIPGANVLRVGQLVDDCIHGAELVVLLLWARSDFLLVRQKAKLGDLGKLEFGRRLGRCGYLLE